MEGTDGTDFADIPTRPMRVKILYTFDAEAKTTCLARLPNTLDIPAVAIDEQSQVGVIELQQCILAILSASPEIHSVLENGDFSVYTYDYSEFDAPVVGQGRISSLLAVPTSAGQDNKTMITGRVCKNIALFNNGVKETLEVKFKLTPLSRPTRGELAKNVDSMRSMSPATSAGFDPNAWNASVHSKTQQVPSDFFNFDMSSMSGDNGAASLEAMFGLETSNSGETHDPSQQPGGVGIQETPTDSAFAYNPAFSNQSHSAPGSRAGSPMMPSSSNSRNGMIRHQSFAGNLSDLPAQNRPASRASVGSESYQSHPAQQPVQQSFQQQHIQQQTDIFYSEDGQPRKRAKVVQADWRGKSSFGSKSSDLRVTAATTSSMQMFRPIAKRPAAPGSDLEPPPRVPTPVPKRIRPIQARMPSRAPKSSLRQASVAESDFMSDIEPHSDAMTSPEGSSPENSMNGEGTPMDIPSSPPIVPGYNMPHPSSPGLPTLRPPRLADSGYMSGGFQSSTVMESMEEGDRSPDADDLALASRYRPRKRQLESFVKTEGSPVDEQGPQTALAMSPDESLSTSRRGSLALPKKPAQGQASKAATKQKRRSLRRSQTANESEAGSPAPSDTESQSRPRGGRSGSSAPRQVIIQRRLQESIAKGEMPQFCSHCGAIETPVWRKLYVKGFDGAPGTLDSVEGEGETIGIEIQERNHEGHCVKYLIRKSMKKTKDFQPGPGFEQVTVCNPCGLWFNKFRNMRPANRWHRKTMPRNRKKRGDDDATDGLEPPSEAFFTDQIVPEDAAEETVTEDTRPGASAVDERFRPAAPSHRPRANSMQEQHQNVRRAQRDPEYMRAVQSSPVRQGSQDSPIEVDLTPNPTRRLLFPSPRRDGEDKSLEDGVDVPRPRSAPTADQMSGKKPSGKVPYTPEQMDVSIFEVFTHDKENRAPAVGCNDDLSHLFDGSPGSLCKTPSRNTRAKSLTTPRSQKSYGELLKTPTQSSRKRKPLTPSANAANNADTNANANDFMTSPSSARYFLRSTPSRLERTPGGRTVSGGSRNPSNEVSPFSRHLAQMLSDANGMDGASFTSPSRQFDFSDLPTFTTPGREVDWKGLDDMLSSEFANYGDGNGMAFSADVKGDNERA